MYQQVAETGQATPEAVELLRRSSPVSVAGQIKMPTLLLQGQRDSLFPLDQADANAKAIAATGAPGRAWPGSTAATTAATARSTGSTTRPSPGSTTT